MNVPDKILNGFVLVKVMQQKKAYTSRREDGSEFKLEIAKPLQIEGYADEHLYQPNFGIAVCDTDNDIKKDDIVYFDVDMGLKDYTLWYECSEYKIIKLRCVSTFHKETHETFKQITWKEGMIFKQSEIYAVRRDGQLYGNDLWWLAQINDNTVVTPHITYQTKLSLIETEIAAPQLNIIKKSPDSSKPGAWIINNPHKDYYRKKIVVPEEITLEETFDGEKFWVVDEDDMVVEGFDFKVVASAKYKGKEYEIEDKVEVGSRPDLTDKLNMGIIK